MKLIKVKMLGGCTMAGRSYEAGDVAEGKPRDIQPLIDCGVAETWAPPKRTTKKRAKKEAKPEPAEAGDDGEDGADAEVNDG